MLLTNDQYKLLDNLYKIGPRRTNILAKSLGWDNQHMPHVGLQLREQKLVSSTNDGAEYNKWDITATGRAKYLEETAARKPKKVAKEAPVTVPQQEVYAVVPEAGAGGFCRFSNYDEALAKAKQFTATLGKDHEVVAIRSVAVVHYTKPVPAIVSVEVKP